MQVIVLVPNLAFVLHNDSILYITTFAASVETVWACSKLFCSVKKGREYYVIDHTLRVYKLLFCTILLRAAADLPTQGRGQHQDPRAQDGSQGAPSGALVVADGVAAEVTVRQVRADRVRRPGWHNV
jgi:hypothetical protein